MKKTVFYILFLSLLNAPLFGQQDSIHQLEEVVLSDVRLYQNSRGNRLQVLQDSLLEKNEPFLGSVLKFNSPIYFRENGPGMVSSASFRGTSASQTAVIWNGININSQFTGQTDFNTLLTSGYNNVVVRSGGGSVLYGSGAIGGSIHLNNRFQFDKGFDHKLQFKYGSFETFFGNLRSEFSSENTSLQLNISRHSSENDYPYLGTEKENLNGDYTNTGVSAAVAHIIDSRNIIKLFTDYYYGDRGFSGTLTAPSSSKYQDVNSRNLLEWQGFFRKVTSNLRLAYLDETYRYYENRNSNDHTFGRAKIGIAKIDLNYRLNDEMSLTGLADITISEGEGTSIGDKFRRTGSGGILFSHELDRFNYELSVRKEFSEKYNSPILFSVSSGYEVNDHYGMVLNFSRNYRIPTLNDLFWYAGGNDQLKPETSLQAELGQNFHFYNVELGITAYWIKIDDLLRWVPQQNGQWRPENTKSARSYGAEALAEWQQSFGQHRVNIEGTYAFTRSQDLETKNQLIYVPRHKVTAAAGYGIRRFSAWYQFLYNGSVFTSSDNNYSLNDYTVSNLGLEYDLLKNRELNLGVELRNIWNTNYQSLPGRPMPGRAIYTSLTYKL